MKAGDVYASAELVIQPHTDGNELAAFMEQVAAAFQMAKSTGRDCAVPVPVKGINIVDNRAHKERPRDHDDPKHLIDIPHDELAPKQS